MRGFLLDSNVAGALGPALTHMRECHVVHLADWHQGAYLDAGDAAIFAAAAGEDLVVVSHDIRTMPEIASDMIASRKPFAGVAFAVERVFSRDVGALARALADLLDHPERLESGYPVVYLRPVTRQTE